MPVECHSGARTWKCSLFLPVRPSSPWRTRVLYADLRSYVRRVEESQQALLRAEKMAAAGRLTASIAHEVNNPLQSVQNCLHLARAVKISPEKRKEYFELAKKELDRLMKTMQRMLDFYRPGAAQGRTGGCFGITAACAESDFAAIGSTTY